MAYMLSSAWELVFRIVVDTNVFVGALLRHEGQNRQILRACLEERARPIMGQALFCEYEDVLGRKELFRDSLLSTPDRQRLFEAFLSVCAWVHVYYGWRPNLRDETAQLGQGQGRQHQQTHR